jgi:hypothetical protein
LPVLSPSETIVVGDDLVSHVSLEATPVLVVEVEGPEYAVELRRGDDGSGALVFRICVTRFAWLHLFSFILTSNISFPGTFLLHLLTFL